MMDSTFVERRFVRLRSSLLRATTALCSGILPLALASPATAQQLSGPAAISPNIDQNGVDIGSGSIQLRSVDLSIGAGAHPLKLIRKVNIFSNLADFAIMSLVAYDVNTGDVQVQLPNKTRDFKFISAGNWENQSKTGEKYTDGKLTDSDGTIYEFTIDGGASADNSGVWYVSKITYPDGYVVDLTWQESYVMEGNIMEYQYPRWYPHLVTIQDNLGQAVSITYQGTVDGFGQPDDPDAFRTPATATISNSLGASNSVSYAFSYNAATGVNSQTVTSRSGRVKQYSGSLSANSVDDDNGKISIVNYDIGNPPQYDRKFDITRGAKTTTYIYSDGNQNNTSVANTLTVSSAGEADRIFSLTNGLSLDAQINSTSIDGKLTQYAYDADGRLTDVTQPEGNKIHYGYDARGNVVETREVAKPGSGLADIATTASFSVSCDNLATCNQPLWIRDARGNQTDYEYNSTTGQILSVTSPAPVAGGVRPKVSYGYQSVSGVSVPVAVSTCATAQSCSGTSQETKISTAYDSSLRPTSVTTAAGDGSVSSTVTLGYDAAGNLTSSDGPLAGDGDKTYYRYDDDRELVGAVAPDPDGGGPLKRKAVRNTYNSKGLLTEVELGTVNGVGNADWNAFSSQQQTIATLDSDGRKTAEAQSAGGVTYAKTQFSYGASGQLDCVAVRMNPAVYGSLPSSACTLGTAGNAGSDRITKLTYDSVGRVAKSTSGYGTSDQSDDTAVTYTDNGKIATATDAEGNKTSYTYDGFDRLSKTNYPSTTKGSGTSSTTDFEQLGYDANGNVTSRLLRGGTLTINYNYDNLNRLKTKDLPGTEPDVTYDYDLLGHLTSAATSAQTLSFTYDALGRNLTQTGAIGTVGYQYDAAGRRTRLTWPDAYYVTYDYQVTGEVTTIKENGTTTLGTYAYDDLGRRQTLTRGNGVVTSYSFDPVSRLSSLVSDLPGTTNDLTLGLSYNPASQITLTTRSNNAYSWTGATNVARNYTSNGLNQYSATTSTTFGYDARGNLTNSGSDTYTYSSENLLLTGPNSASLTYDPLMRLYQSGNATVASKNLYDGANLIGLYNPSTGAMTRRYILGPGTDELLIEYSVPAAANRWAIADERGSVTAFTDTSGNLLGGINTYDEYGIPGAGNAGRYQYTGQIWLPELGMYYYKARMYSPTLGRFMQTDPIGYGDGMNWYNYVRSDPVNFTDPTGNGICVNPVKTYSGYECPGGIIVSNRSGFASQGGYGSGEWGPQQDDVDRQRAMDFARNRQNPAMNRVPQNAQPAKTWLGCTGTAALKNWKGLALDTAGWAALVIFPEGSAATAIAGSVIGVTAIGVAAADSKEHPAIAATSGALAYVGKQGAAAEGMLKGSASALGHRIGLYGLIASSALDVGLSIRDFKNCMSGKGGD